MKKKLASGAAVIAAAVGIYLHGHKSPKYSPLVLSVPCHMGEVGVPYRCNLIQSGNPPYNCKVTFPAPGLPLGLYLDTVQCAIVGTPQQKTTGKVLIAVL